MWQAGVTTDPQETRELGRADTLAKGRSLQTRRWPAFRVGGGRDDVFGSCQQLLLTVTFHPAMGAYLSHFNNDRSTI
jgi:hypothetical protein